MGYQFDISSVTILGKSDPLNVVEKILPKEKTLSGVGEVRNELYFRDPKDVFTCGVWECSPCSFTAKYEEDEFYYMIEGEVVIHDQFGASVRITPGQAVVVPAGFEGKWDVVKFTRKFYAHNRPDAT